jgi:DNA repair protein RadC
MYSIPQYKLVTDDYLKPVLEVEKTYKTKQIEYEGIDDITGIFYKIIHMEKDYVERVYVVSFDSQLKITGICELCKGTNGNSSVPINELFTYLLLVGSKRFVLAHNHPGGSPNPSEDDYKSTKAILDACGYFGFEFIDDMVIAKNSYTNNTVEYVKEKYKSFTDLEFLRKII